MKETLSNEMARYVSEGVHTISSEHDASAVPDVLAPKL